MKSRFHEIAKEIAKREGKKKQVDIAQICEILRIYFEIQREKILVENELFGTWDNVDITSTTLTSNGLPPATVELPKYRIGLPQQVVESVKRTIENAKKTTKKKPKKKPVKKKKK